jgi:hypothetical protein
VATRLLLEGGDLQALLARVRAEHGPDARIVSADRLRRGGVAGFFSRQWFEIGVELPDDPAPPAGAVPDHPPPAAPGPTAAAGGTSDAFAALLADADRADSTGGTLGRHRAPATPSAAAAPPVPTPATPAVAAPTAPHPVPAPAAPAVAAPALAAPAAPDPAAALAVPQPAVALAARTVPGGVPAVAARAVPCPVTGDGVPTRLVPLPGLVVVVAGELARSMEVASWVAARLRIAPELTLVAGPAISVHPGMRLCGPEHAAAVATDLHRRDTPVVVAVESRVDDPDGGRWAGAVVTALRADVLVATVDATRKTADLRRHLTDLGTVDAVAVHGGAACVDPSTVLELGLPVMLVDGRPGGLATG